MTTNMVDILGKDLRKAYPGLHIGNLVWYYVPTDAQVKTKEWIAACEEHKIDEMVPTRPRAVDAFKRAIAKIGKSGKVTLTDDKGESVSYKFMARDSGQTADNVFRDLVVERLGENQLSYGPVVKFKFNRSNKELSAEIDDAVFEQIPVEVQAEIQGRADAAYDQYNTERFVLGPMKVRDLIRTELEDQQLAISCKTGAGIYFVFDQHFDRTEKLSLLLGEFASHGIEFHSVPLPNVEGQRNMIIKAFENETLGEVDQLMGDMTATLKGERGKITTAVAKRYTRDFKRLNDRLSQFSDELEQKFEQVGDRLDLMRAQTIKIVENIHIDDLV